MDTTLYLAYGSNLLPARLAARLSALTAVGVTELPGWRLCFHKLGTDGSGKCNLVADSNAVAHGALYQFSLDDKSRLDVIEGVGNGYTGKLIEVPDIGESYVYLADPAHIDNRLVPYDWYHAFVASGARHHQFPPEYLAEIDSVATIRDPDETRRTENLRIQHLGKL